MARRVYKVALILDLTVITYRDWATKIEGCFASAGFLFVWLPLLLLLLQGLDDFRVTANAKVKVAQLNIFRPKWIQKTRQTLKRELSSFTNSETLSFGSDLTSNSNQNASKVTNLAKHQLTERPICEHWSDQTKKFPLFTNKFELLRGFTTNRIR